MSFKGGGVWATNLDGVLYIYENAQGLLEGIYTRNQVIVGILYFDRKMEGKWIESKARGTFQFDSEQLMKSSNRNLVGSFTISGHGDREYPWTGRLIEDKEQSVTSSLLPFQLRWVEAFNAKQHQICSSMYTDNAVFIMYHYPARGQHHVAKGRNKIRSWWKAVVESAGLMNMKASPIPGKTSVVDGNEVMVSYDTVQFDTPDAKRKFNGIIHCEQWVRGGQYGGAWMVKRDVTEQTF